MRIPREFELPGDVAIALGYTLATDNEPEFSRVPELSWENWLR